MSKTTSFFWFDYETFGTHPAWDRPCQFAGVRTDTDLNVIGDPLVVYCRQSSDYLPHPGACKVTGITPQRANDEGVCEAEFIDRIRHELAFAGTCSVGYNNIRFDDEFTRHTLFRNLHDAYEHEWKDGCSRWDLLDVVRMTRALRPDGLKWPMNDEGKPSNRLEHLSAANGIEHSQAHDAMSDVWATLGMARLIRRSQPKLFDYAFSNRGKQAVSSLLNTQQRSPVIQVSGMIPGSRHHVGAILPIAQHPVNRNSVIVLDLDQDSRYLAELDSDEIARRLFAHAADTGRDSAERRPGLRTVQINKCPVIVPLAVVREADAERLSIDKHLINLRSQECQDWLTGPVLDQITRAMTRDWDSDTAIDVDGSLYGGDFLQQSDKQRLATIRTVDPQQIADHQGHFDDSRLDEMVWRYRARNYPETLNAEERDLWREHCSQRLNDTSAPWLTLDQYEDALAEVFGAAPDDKTAELPAALRRYAQSLA